MTEKHHAKYSVAVGCVIHVLAFIVSLTGLLYSLLYISEHGEGVWEYQGWPGKFKFLTFWSQCTLPVYFLICVINDVAGGNTTDRQVYVHRSTLQTLRDNFHATWTFPIGTFVVSTFWILYGINRELVFPQEMDKIIPVWHNHVKFVVTSFWAIYAIDRELVYPKRLDKYIPVWVNHVAHTSPIVWLLLEKMFVNISYPRWKTGLLYTTTFTAVYLSWILWIAHSQGIWAYPILRVLDVPRRTAFLSVMCAYICLVYLVGQWLSHQLWWGPAHHAKPKAKKTKKLS